MQNHFGHEIIPRRSWSAHALWLWFASNFKHSPSFRLGEETWPRWCRLSSKSRRIEASLSMIMIKLRRYNDENFNGTKLWFKRYECSDLIVEDNIDDSGQWLMVNNLNKNNNNNFKVSWNIFDAWHNIIDWNIKCVARHLLLLSH